MKKDVKGITDIIDLPDELLEVKYYEHPKDTTYLSWKLPVHVVRELTVWWKEMRAKHCLIP